MDSLIDEVDEKFQLQTRFPTTRLLIRMFVQIMINAHVSCCLFHWIGEQERKRGEENWLVAQNLEDASWRQRYLNSLYFTVINMSTVGFGDISPKSANEKIYVILITLLSCGQYGYVINTIGQIFAEKNQKEADFKAQKYKVQIYMRNRNINPILMQQVIKYLDYIKGIQQESPDQAQGILSRVQTDLQMQIKEDFYGNLLQGQSLFMKNFSERFLKFLAQKMREVVYGPGQLIYKLKEQDNRMYIIYKGSVELYIHQHRDVQIYKKMTSTKSYVCQKLKKGDLFGEQEFLSEIPRQTYAKSTGISHLVYFTQEDIRDIFEEQELQLDFERFNLLKDQKLFSNYTEDQSCYACNKFRHTVLNCPFLHCVRNQQFVISRYEYTRNQERQKTEEQSMRKRYRSMSEREDIRAALKKFRISKIKKAAKAIQKREQMQIFHAIAKERFGYINESNSQLSLLDSSTSSSSSEGSSIDSIDIKNNQDDLEFFFKADKIAYYNGKWELNNDEENDSFRFSELDDGELLSSDEYIEEQEEEYEDSNVNSSASSVNPMPKSKPKKRVSMKRNSKYIKEEDEENDVDEDSDDDLVQMEESVEFRQKANTVRKSTKNLSFNLSPQAPFGSKTDIKFQSPSPIRLTYQESLTHLDNKNSLNSLSESDSSSNCKVKQKKQQQLKVGTDEFIKNIEQQQQQQHIYQQQQQQKNMVASKKDVTKKSPQNYQESDAQKYKRMQRSARHSMIQLGFAQTLGKKQIFWHTKFGKRVQKYVQKNPLPFKSQHLLNYEIKKFVMQLFAGKKSNQLRIPKQSKFQISVNNINNNSLSELSFSFDELDTKNIPNYENMKQQTVQAQFACQQKQFLKQLNQQQNIFMSEVKSIIQKSQQQITRHSLQNARLSLPPKQLPQIPQYSQKIINNMNASSMGGMQLIQKKGVSTSQKSLGANSQTQVSNNSNNNNNINNNQPQRSSKYLQLNERKSQIRFDQAQIQSQQPQNYTYGRYLMNPQGNNVMNMSMAHQTHAYPKQQEKKYVHLFNNMKNNQNNNNLNNNNQKNEMEFSNNRFAKNIANNLYQKIQEEEVRKGKSLLDLDATNDSGSYIKNSYQLLMHLSQNHLIEAQHRQTIEHEMKQFFTVMNLDRQALFTYYFPIYNYDKIISHYNAQIQKNIKDRQNNNLVFRLKEQKKRRKSTRNVSIRFLQSGGKSFHQTPTNGKIKFIKKRSQQC